MRTTTQSKKVSSKRRIRQNSSNANTNHNSNQDRASGFSLFESLENRQLMSVVSVADFGARPNDGGDDRGAIQRAIDASQPGDTVKFEAGEYTNVGMLRLKGNRTYQGGTLRTSNSPWAATVEGNSSNVTITGMKFIGGGIDLGGGSRYSNIRITNNEFSDMPGHAIAQRVYTDTLVITNNTFKNIRAYGTIETYNTDRLNYSYNRVIDSTHGGHILGPLADCVMSNNYMTGLTDWMLEVQDSGSSVSRNMKIENNVAYDYRKGYGNTGGLSIVNHGDGTQIKNNYLRANFLPGTNFSEGHLHVAIEWNIESVNSVISGNVIGCERSDEYTFVQGVGYLPLSGATMTNNKFYGKFNGGWGMGMPVQLPATGTNSWDRNYASMPAPPTVGNPIPTPNPNPNPTPTPTPDPAPEPAPTIAAPTNLRGTALSPSQITLAWTDASNNETGFRVERKTTRGGDAWVAITTLPAGATKFADSGLNAGWEYDYRVVAFNASGSNRSGTLTVKTLAGVGSPAPTPTPTPTPTPEPVATPTLTGHALSTTQIELDWQDVYRSESGYKIERKTTHGTDSWVTVANPRGDATSFVDSGLNRTWEYDYRITVFTADGNATSATITVQTMLQETVSGTFKAVYVSDLDWRTVTNGVGVPEIDTTNGHADSGDGVTMRLDGKKFSKGVGVHSNSKLEYLIGGKYQTFQSYIGLDDCVRDKGSVVFQVWGDGRKLYDSGLMTGKTKARKISVNVAGSKQLWLVVNHGGDGRQYDYANWANARLLQTV